jgi:adenine-specific DNA methylase
MRASLESAQKSVTESVDRCLTALGIEHDESGNRAKAYLYCVEVRCPVTGWIVPLLPSLIVSKIKRTVARLVPDRERRRFDLEIVDDVSSSELESAKFGTIRNKSLVYELDGETYRTPIATIRGDSSRGRGDASSNNLRRWERQDIAPREDDIFRERLYCIQWMRQGTLDRARPETFFRAPDQNDIRREQEVFAYVSDHLADWQAAGFVPDLIIEPGENTSQPIKERGWSYWHHLFTPRQLLIGALLAEEISRVKDEDVRACLSFDRTFVAHNSARLSQWLPGTPAKPGVAPSADTVKHVFYNQALNTFYNFGCRAFYMVKPNHEDAYPYVQLEVDAKVATHTAKDFDEPADLIITDPPYADAVNYHEITEFFIAWLRRNPPAPFADWVWDSRRMLAIRGSGDDFRLAMVEAYRRATDNMPDNGLQIVMFTHQDAAVWADMAQIFWGAGLQVASAWYVSTETTSDTKKGGYVQGTVTIVLRKRSAGGSGYKDEIVQEVKAEVAEQIDTMVGLNQNLKGHGRVENLFEDADLQMAGYAAALRVLTKYEKIDGADMTKEALRPRRAGDKNLVAEIINFAVQVANEHMVPEHMTPKLWEGLTGAERFYLKMMDIETTSLRKLDNYQNFAKAFRVDGYDKLMGPMDPNKARLKTAKEFKKNSFEIPEFGPSITRAALYGIFELENDVEGDDVLSHLKDLLPNYHNKRDDLAAIADYIARKREAVDETESRAARILHGLIRNERLG